MHPFAAIAFGVLLVLAQDGAKSGAKDFGKTFIVKVQAKTRWSTSFRQADFDRDLKKHADELRVTGREAIEEDKAGWDQWTFEAAESWKLELDVIQLIFGRHIIIRRYDIVIEGSVKADAQRTYWLTHEPTGKRYRLCNRPKLPKETEVPPDIRSKIDAAVKAGQKTFRVTGEIILNPTPAVLLDTAEPVEEEKK
ncbi:MAG TPA: hypothetical protein VK661_05505 [Planctomycetota bacterium]|nr:hypothetical protein [Planctomycetota bacterium]